MAPPSGIVGLASYMFPLLLSFYTFTHNMDRMEDSVRSSMRGQNQNDTFDFIIVGSGSSGSVLAYRLSEKFSVLLLEAGGNPNPITSIPSLTFPLYWAVPEDWKYSTVPLKHTGFGLNNNSMHWPAGKGLGGSSNINGMIYMRGTVQGFDILANQTEDLIWSMENVLKYYQKIEDYDGRFDKSNHGKGGGISVQKGHVSPYVKHLMRAGEELGYKVRDPNQMSPLTPGFSPMELFTKNGLRWSSYNGYILPAMNQRPLLTIRKFSQVYKVILDEDNVAKGVEYLYDGRTTRSVKARKEVILSAGAIESARILLLSGIGPKAELKRHGIPLKLNLPVGKRLQDKYGAIVGPFLVDPGYSTQMSALFTMPPMAEFLMKGKGPYTTSGADAIYSIISPSSLKAGKTTPDIHSYVTYAPIVSGFESIVNSGSFNYKPELTSNYLSHAYGKDAIMKLVCLNKPLSYGTLKLRDKDPRSPLLLDPNYLNDPKDVKTLVEGIKFAVKVMEGTTSMKKIGTRLLPIPLPGCELEKFKSDAYWECLARATPGTAFKYCATAPLGKGGKGDRESVVDSRLRVLGAKRLRVIDASVLQERFVSVNHVTCTMLGELASDFILKAYE